MKRPEPKIVLYISGYHSRICFGDVIHLSVNPEDIRDSFMVGILRIILILIICIRGHFLIK